MRNSRPIDGVRITVTMPAMLSPKRLAPVGRCSAPLVLDDGREHDPDQQRGRRHQQKAAAPADRRGREGQRRGRDQRADRADADLQAGERREPVGAETGAHRPRAAPSGRPSRPSPSKARARMSPPAMVADANRMAPSTVIAAQTRRQRRGPNRSSATPSGICAAANAKKNALDNSADLGRRKTELGRQVGRDDADRIAQELADDVDRDQRADQRRRAAAAMPCGEALRLSVLMTGRPSITGRPLAGP